MSRDRRTYIKIAQDDANLDLRALWLNAQDASDMIRIRTENIANNGMKMAAADYTELVKSVFAIDMLLAGSRWLIFRDDNGREP